MIYEKPRILSATEARVAELQAFLRKSPSFVYPEDVIPYVDAVETEVLALQAENEKLRDLFAGWRYCHDYRRPRHEGCPLYRETDDYSDWHNWCRMDEVLRELGIEVDG